MVELPAERRLPADLSRPQRAGADARRSTASALLQPATLPTRATAAGRSSSRRCRGCRPGRCPRSRPATPSAVLGFTFAGEKGDAVIRAEYCFAGGKVYGLRSSPR